MFERDLLDKLFVYDQNGKDYICFTHSDKVWIIPEDNYEPALEMYQPSTIKGKALKSCIRFCCRSKVGLGKVGVYRRKLSFHSQIHLYLKSIVNEEDIYIAAYMGDTTTKQNNKVTLQIYNNQKILCYGKITKEPEVMENFSREIEGLKYLEKKGIDSIPKVLGEKKIEELKIFVQSTNKPLRQRVQLVFGRKQIEFIHNIVKKTQTHVRYETSDFYIMVQYLKDNAMKIGKNEKEIIFSAVKWIETYAKEKGMSFSFCHGDYTPWNVYYQNGEISGFDFEYCFRTMPAYMDVFHYLTQLSIMGKNNDAGETIKLYQSCQGILREYMSDTDVIYGCYLLYIIGFYYSRTDGDCKCIGRRLEIWLVLLQYLLTENERI